MPAVLRARHSLMPPVRIPQLPLTGPPELPVRRVWPLPPPLGRPPALVRRQRGRLEGTLALSVPLPECRRRTLPAFPQCPPPSPISFGGWSGLLGAWRQAVGGRRRLPGGAGPRSGWRSTGCRRPGGRSLPFPGAGRGA